MTIYRIRPLHFLIPVLILLAGCATPRPSAPVKPERVEPPVASTPAITFWIGEDAVTLADLESKTWTPGTLVLVKAAKQTPVTEVAEALLHLHRLSFKVAFAEPE